MVLGVPASAQAGSGTPIGTVIDQYQSWMSSQSFNIAGMFIWDSYWDAQNGYVTSNTILTSAASSQPLTPSSNTPATPIC